MRPPAVEQLAIPVPGATGKRVLLFASPTYAGLILLMWLPFNPCGGMPYESHFLLNSEYWPIRGFLFPSDLMRPHTSTFYHVSFLLGEALGIGGSFFPFQIVYAVLWWARGFLMLLILRRLVPGHDLLSFCCGALVVVHASDHALLWVGQLNQFGFLFWMLLGFYLFVLAVQPASTRRTRWYIAGAAAAQHMSLWSYESQLLLILAAPLAVFLADREQARAKLRILAAWYAMPALYLLASFFGYFLNLAGTYQAAVLRTEWSVEAITRDLWFNLRASLMFWRWSENLPWQLSSDWLTVFGLLGAAVYLAGAAGWIFAKSGSERPPWPQPRFWLALLLTGLAAVLLGFPAYLLLGSAATLWRTQFLSSIGAALVLTSLAGLAAGILPRQRLRVLAFVALGALICGYGVAAALRSAALHDRIWARQRQAFEALLRLAPRLPENAIVVAVNVPKGNDPFGHNMWFNFGLRLAYPGSKVNGIYFYDDGSAGRGNHLQLESSDWVWTRALESPGYERCGLDRTVVVAYDTVQRARILEELPEELSPVEEASALYAPQAVILDGPPSPRAARRYFPCPQWWWTLSPER